MQILVRSLHSRRRQWESVLLATKMMETTRPMKIELFDNILRSVFVLNWNGLTVHNKTADRKMIALVNIIYDRR